MTIISVYEIRDNAEVRFRISHPLLRTPDITQMDAKMNLNQRRNNIGKYNVKSMVLNCLKDECRIKNGGCNEICIYNYSLGIFICMCSQGKKLDKSGKICLENNDSSTIKLNESLEIKTDSNSDGITDRSGSPNENFQAWGSKNPEYIIESERPTKLESNFNSNYFLESEHESTIKSTFKFESTAEPKSVIEPSTSNLSESPIINEPTTETKNIFKSKPAIKQKSKSRPSAELNSDSEPPAEQKSKNVSITMSALKNKPSIEPKPKPIPQIFSERIPESEHSEKLKVISESSMKMKSDLKPRSKTISEPSPSLKLKVKPESSARLKPEPDQSAQLESKPEIPVESTSKYKPFGKTILKPGASVRPKSVFELSVEPTSKFEASEKTIELIASTERTQESEPSLELNSELELSVEVELKPKPSTETKSEPASSVETESELEVKSESEAVEQKLEFKPSEKSKSEHKLCARFKDESKSSLELKSKFEPLIKLILEPKSFVNSKSISDSSEISRRNSEPSLEQNSKPELLFKVTSEFAEIKPNFNQKNQFEINTAATRSKTESKSEEGMSLLDCSKSQMGIEKWNESTTLNENEENSANPTEVHVEDVVIYEPTYINVTRNVNLNNNSMIYFSNKNNSNVEKLPVKNKTDFKGQNIEEKINIYYNQVNQLNHTYPAINIEKKQEPFKVPIIFKETRNETMPTSIDIANSHIRQLINKPKGNVGDLYNGITDESATKVFWRFETDTRNATKGPLILRNSNEENEQFTTQVPMLPLEILEVSFTTEVIEEAESTVLSGENKQQNRAIGYLKALQEDTEKEVSNIQTEIINFNTNDKTTEASIIPEGLQTIQSNNSIKFRTSLTISNFETVSENLAENSKIDVTTTSNVYGNKVQNLHDNT